MSKYSATAARQSKDAQPGREQHRYSLISSRNAPSSRKWSFGFRYFQQIKNFGLDASKVKNNWLVGVLERFAELGALDVDQVIGNKSVADSSRCHLINWKQKNIPIQPSDLDWIPNEYSNAEEFPLMQFAVSKAMGRVIGFFDAEWTFQLVLLDPLHNAQPSRDYGYKVDLCHPLGCELTTLRKKVEDTLSNAPACECGVGMRLSNLLTQPASGSALVFCVSRDDLPQQLDEVLQSKLANSIQDILAAGVDVCLAR